jgi:hypothetical protein
MARAVAPPAVGPMERAYDVGRAIRDGVESDTMYVATMATTGMGVGALLTGGNQWGAGVGLASGWVVGVVQLRRRR